jgi:glycosyltransferase involved in cell wall biosynthesis
MVNLPKISIVIPSYNQGPFIERTIQSILNQNYPDLELILMDGGSKDQTMEIVKKYAGFFSHIQSTPDGGQAAAIKRGFEIATGEFLTWLNSDDTYQSGSLLKAGQWLIDHPDCKFAYGNNFYIDQDDKVITEKIQPRAVLAVMKYAYLTVPQMSAFWRRDLYLEAGGIDAKLQFAMDYDLFVRMAQMHLPSHFGFGVGNFRIHNASKTTNLEHIRRAEDAIVHTRYCSIKPSSKVLFWLVQKWYQFVCILLFVENGSFKSRFNDRRSKNFKSLAS